MTKQEFDMKVFSELYSECQFLYGYDEMVKSEEGKCWYTNPLFMQHAIKFKKQMLNHIYAKRRFDLRELQYV